MTPMVIEALAALMFDEEKARFSQAHAIYEKQPEHVKERYRARATLRGRYKSSIAWCMSTEQWVATSPDIPGCMAAGGTPEKALRALQATIVSWLETARSLGMPSSTASFFDVKAWSSSAGIGLLPAPTPRKGIDIADLA